MSSVTGVFDPSPKEYSNFLKTSTQNVSLNVKRRRRVWAPKQWWRSNPCCGRGFCPEDCLQVTYVIISISNIAHRWFLQNPWLLLITWSSQTDVVSLTKNLRGRRKFTSTTWNKTLTLDFRWLYMSEKIWWLCDFRKDIFSGPNEKQPYTLHN